MATALMLRRLVVAAAPAVRAISSAPLPRMVTRGPDAVRHKGKVALVLLEQIDELGYKGEEVRVAPGRARNHLIPKRLAVYATPANRASHKVVLSPEEEALVARERAANMMRRRISRASISLARATKDGTNLVSPLTTVDVLEQLVALPELRKLQLQESNLKFENESGYVTEVGVHTVLVDPEKAGFPGMWAPLQFSVSST